MSYFEDTLQDTHHKVKYEILQVLIFHKKRVNESVETCFFVSLMNSVVQLCREQSTQAILQALRDETLNDPRDRIEIAQSHAFYRPSLLGQP